MREINKPEDESRDGESQADEENKQKQATNDYKDSYEMSKLALLKCRQIPSIHKDFPRAGDGHFVSNPFKTIRNTYRTVFDTPDPVTDLSGKKKIWE